MKVNIHNTKLNYKYDFETANNGIIGIYGISGSGKSSLLNALAGYDSDCIGTIEFNNKKLNGITQCAYMSQHPILFPHWTVKENLLFAYNYNNRSFTDFVKLLECEPLLEKYPNQLSGGEKQRIAFIRTLIQIKRNSLVLLDEPFSALDKRLRKIALTLLTECKNCLVLLVTHDISELYLIADEFIYIDSCQITLHDTISNTMASGFKDLPIASKVTINKIPHIVYALDVSISLSKDNNSSITHQLMARIVKIKSFGAWSLVELNYIENCKTYHFFAKLTKKSIKKLSLKENQEIIANFKSMALRNF